MKYSLLLILFVVRVTVCNASAASPSELNERIVAEWQRLVSQAAQKSCEIDAQLAKNPSDEGLLSEKVDYSIPGIILKQLAIQNFMAAKPNSTISPNVDGAASSDIQKEQMVIVQATRLFLLNTLKTFLVENPSYGTQKSDLISREYLEKIVSQK